MNALSVPPLDDAEEERDAALAQLSDAESELNLLRDAQAEVDGLQKQAGAVNVERDRMRNEIEQLKLRLEEAEAQAALAISFEASVDDKKQSDEAAAAALARKILPLLIGLRAAIEHLEMIGEDASEEHVVQLKRLFSALDQICGDVSPSDFTDPG